MYSSLRGSQKDQYIPESCQPLCSSTHQAGLEIAALRVQVLLPTQLQGKRKTLISGDCHLLGLHREASRLFVIGQISRRTRHGAMVSSPFCCAQTKGPLLAFSFLQSSVSKDVLNTANVSDMLFFPILYGISQLILLLLPSPSLCSTWISLRTFLFLIY